MVQAWPDVEEMDWNLPVQDNLLFFLDFQFFFWVCLLGVIGNGKRAGKDSIWS